MFTHVRALVIPARRPAGTAMAVLLILKAGLSTEALGADWTYTSPNTGTRAGHSVAPAGDVNGDGYSDFLLGEPLLDNGQTDEGRVYLFYGSATGPSPTPGWAYESNVTLSQTGIAVSTAGDVNGDGYDDVLIGAPGYGSNLGRIELFFGSAAGLSTTPGHTFNGSQASTGYGSALGTAGDVNGDGYDDIVFGYPRYDGLFTNGGRLVLYYGSASGIAPGSAVIVGNVAEGRLGNSVGTAGDVNGDGYADVIAGSYLYTNGQLDEGRASVYHGGPAGLSTTAAWVAEGNQSDMWFGYSVSTAGDVNGDGYSDVIIGAPHYDNVGTDDGQVRVYLGGPSGLAGSPAWIQSLTLGKRAGWSVATGGDVDADGYADVILGSPAFGSVGSGQVVLGSATGPTAVGQKFLFGTTSGGEAGYSVATAGDVNGDGHSDYLMSEPFPSGQGSVHLYFGSAAVPSTFADWAIQDPPLTPGEAASAGDVNGDGYSDVIIAATRVLHGSPTGPDTTAAWTAGTAVSGIEDIEAAGDVNGDGYSDIIVGTPHVMNPGGTQGAAHVFLGSAVGLALQPAWSVPGGFATGTFGLRVGTAGDVDGDGFGDAFVSAGSGGVGDEGYVSVYLGSANGLSGSPAWTVYADQPSTGFGSDVGAAGDVNGDGYSDLIVGAPSYDFGQGEGAAFVYHGSASGLSPTPDWQAQGEMASSLFGHSVAAAGDVNGDGYGDAIVGAPGWLIMHGRAYVYLGTPTGLMPTAVWSTASSPIFNQFWGQSVRGAGDVDGDGFGDILVGSLNATSTNQLHFGSSQGPETVPWTTQSQLGTTITRSASAGDVNGDGFSDILISEAGSGTYARIHFGNGTTVSTRSHQELADGSAPVALLGSVDALAGFRVWQLARSPAGRSDVRLQVEVKPLGVPFNGVGIVTGPASNTGLTGATLTQLVPGLQDGTPYRWRARLLGDSPYFPPSRWTSPEGNGPNETDLRARPDAVSAPAIESSFVGSGVVFAPPSPNPSASATVLRFSLPRPGRVRLGVYDLAGRRVAPLADGLMTGGRHQRTWDGANAQGRAVAPGIYFVRLEVDGAVTTRKVVRVR